MSADFRSRPHSILLCALHGRPNTLRYRCSTEKRCAGVGAVAEAERHLLQRQFAHVHDHRRGVGMRRVGVELDRDRLEQPDLADAVLEVEQALLGVRRSRREPGDVAAPRSPCSAAAPRRGSGRGGTAGRCRTARRAGPAWPARRCRRGSRPASPPGSRPRAAAPAFRPWPCSTPTAATAGRPAAATASRATARSSAPRGRRRGRHHRASRAPATRPCRRGCAGPGRRSASAPAACRVRGRRGPRRRNSPRSRAASAACAGAARTSRSSSDGVTPFSPVAPWKRDRSR